MGKNSDSNRRSNGNDRNNRGGRNNRNNQFNNKNYYGNNGNKNQQQRDSINTIIDSALKKARDDATDTTQPDLGSMSMSINTFSIAEFVEEYNEDFNKNGVKDWRDCLNASADAYDVPTDSTPTSITLEAGRACD